MHVYLDPLVDCGVPEKMHRCMELRSWHCLRKLCIDAPKRAGELFAFGIEGHPAPSHPAKPHVAAVLPPAAVTADHDALPQLGGEVEATLSGGQSLADCLCGWPR
jgi:hypothetical protein